MTPSHYWVENAMVIWAIVGGQYLTIISRGRTLTEVMEAVENHLGGSIPKPFIILSETADEDLCEELLERGLYDIEV